VLDLIYIRSKRINRIDARPLRHAPKGAHPATLRTDGTFIAPFPHDGQQLDTGHLKARQHGRFLATLMTTATAVSMRLPAFGTGSCRALECAALTVAYPPILASCGARFAP
jgi:hypothetical protein